MKSAQLSTSLFLWCVRHNRVSNRFMPKLVGHMVADSPDAGAVSHSTLATTTIETIHDETIASYTINFFSNSIPPPLVICPKCQGEGKFRPKRLAKKARHSNSTLNKSNLMTKSCPSCQGAGLTRDNNNQSQASHPLPPSKPSLPSVAIVGGGIGGLALGLACWHRNIPFCIFERDKTFLERHQGYGLTLQQASKALKGFGFLASSQQDKADTVHLSPTIGTEELDVAPENSSFQLQGSVQSTRHVVFASNGEQLGEWGLRKWGRHNRMAAAKRQNLHIARQALRGQLLGALQQQQHDNHHSFVQWDCRLQNWKETENDVELTFSKADGTKFTTRADFLVGADGIRSTVRNLLLGEDASPLRYLGCLVVLGICPLALVEAADSLLLDGQTVFQTADGTTRLYVMPFSPTEYMWQLSFPMEEVEALAVSKENRLYETALEKCRGWHIPIPQLLQATPDSLISGYPVYDRALLEPEQLNQSKRVTLLGDAAHPMSPFKGQGANQALLDALAFARILFRSNCSRSTASSLSWLKEYEAEMLQRSAIKVKASAEAAEFLHSDVVLQKGNCTRGGVAAAAGVASGGSPSG